MSLRFSSYSSVFLVRAISWILAEKNAPKSKQFRKFFTRILIEDSTVLQIAKSNVDSFPSNGNGVTQTAGCKVNLITDLLNGDAVDCSLHAVRTADQGLSDITLDHAQKGDLIIRDMGHFIVDRLREMTKCKAHWISQLPASINATSLSGERPDDRLADEQLMTLDEEMIVGTNGYKYRVVARRLDRDNSRG